MAVFTTIPPAEAERIAEAYGVGPLEGLVPIQAGTVNTNHFMDTATGRYFLRVYEQQDVGGVRYEWRLLTHLKAKGLPVAAPLEGVEPGQLRVEGKPVALFDLLSGSPLCQARVQTRYLEQLGAILARCHGACEDLGVSHESRFGLPDVVRLLGRARAAGRPELDASLTRLSALAAELGERDTRALPQGVIHGDLFRDNVLWDEQDQLCGLLDWESASDGPLAYDVAVTLLAWCCGDTLDWDLAAALMRGYTAVRPFTSDEWDAFRDLLRLGCLRFATTRIVDVYLPGGAPDRYKNYGRFLQRLDAVEALTTQQLKARLS